MTADTATYLCITLRIAREGRVKQTRQRTLTKTPHNFPRFHKANGYGGQAGGRASVKRAAGRIYRGEP